MYPVRRERQLEILHVLAHYIAEGAPLSWELLEATGSEGGEVHYRIEIQDGPRFWRGFEAPAAG